MNDNIVGVDVIVWMTGRASSPYSN